MKSNAWLVMAVVCGWFTAIQCVCARSDAGISASDLPVRFRFGSGGLIAPKQLPAGMVDFAQIILTYSRATDLRVRSFSRLSDLPSEDEDPADKDRSDDKDLELACLEPSTFAGDWRLNRPDTQRANSFIRTKSKSPP